MPKGGTVDVSAIVQAILSAAAVTATAVLFELLPPRARARPTTRFLPAPPAPRVSEQQPRQRA